jgi:signal transduction histidine kinase
MTVNELLTHLTRFILILLFVITLREYIRHRDKVRLDVTLVFLCLSAGTIIQLIRSVTGLELELLSRISTLALLAQPFLLLRLVRYFGAVPPLLYRAAIIGMVISWIGLLIAGEPLPPAYALAMVAYFVVIDGYAILAFVRGAFSSSGVTRHRLRFAALGSALLVLILIVAGIRTVFPAFLESTLWLLQVLAILCALSYYLGFAPPRFLRQAWQLEELRNFLRGVQTLRTTTTANVVDRLHLAVKRSMETSAVAVVLNQNDRLVLQPISDTPTLQDINLDGVVQRVWREQIPLAVTQSSRLDSADKRMMEAQNADALMIVPISTGERNLGLLMVFLEHGSLFMDDDLDLLLIFAQQKAILLQNHLMLEDMRLRAEDLEEKVQERTAALQRSNDDLRRFAYVASHDLQEPLRTVSLYLQLIEKRYPDKLDEDGREFIAFAVDGATRMKDLIDALLMYSRIESKPRNFTQVDTQAIVDEVCKLLEASINEAEATLTVDHPLPQIKADEQLMLQLFQNLISNAIKYRSDRRPEIHIGASRENGHWVFCVRDNGIGIEPQYLDRIFVIFQRLHDRSTYPGTGIGLAVAKRTVELHGGKIWAESEVGKGTTFYFSIPA